MANRLQPEDWTRAALDAIADGGVRAVAVEKLAPAVGATKGSFYWHFADRAELIRAAMALWERTRTEEMIAAAREAGTPQAQLRRLLANVLVSPLGGRVETALLADPEHPAVGPVLRRVTAKRIGFLTDIFGELGFEPAVAKRKGLAAYSTILGYLSVRQTDPELVPQGGARLDAFVESLVVMMTAPE